MSYHIDQLQRQIDAQREVLQAGDDTRQRRAELEIARLEGLLENAKVNAKVRERRRAERQQAETAKAEAKQEQEQAALEAELRRRYNLALPRPVTDADWETVKESVLHRHAMREIERTEHLVTATARRYAI